MDLYRNYNRTRFYLLNTNSKTILHNKHNFNNNPNLIHNYTRISNLPNNKGIYKQINSNSSNSNLLNIINPIQNFLVYVLQKYNRFSTFIILILRI